MWGSPVAARRSCWTSQLDEAHAFMTRAMNCSVAECGERLLSLVDASREAGVEAAFSDRPHVHGRPRTAVQSISSGRGPGGGGNIPSSSTSSAGVN